MLGVLFKALNVAVLAKVNLRNLAKPCKKAKLKIAKACETLRDHTCKIVRKLAKAV